VGEPSSEAYAVGTLALVLGSLGHHATARDLLERCLGIVQQVHHRRGEAETLIELGRMYRHLGRFGESQEHLARGLALARSAGDPSLTLMALNYQGETLRCCGRPREALARHRAVLKLVRPIGHRYQLARALAGLAAALQDLDKPDQARRFLVCALDLYTELGMPEAAEVRAQL
jgi:tetratricopeptide (TPR) repeat protein